MSIYTTPLHFGYFLALLFALLFWIRAWREERLSDGLLGFVLFFLAMEIQDYTFGFSGINFLWEKLNGFPRSSSLAFAPIIYFYLKAQTNKDFRFHKRDLKHALPFAVYFFTHLFFFVQGPKVVHQWQISEVAYWFNWLTSIGIWISYIIYFVWSLRLYNKYRSWAKTQFSNADVISFTWLRNFIYLIIAGEVFRLSWNLVDMIIDMPYENDWWWHLLTVVIIVYVSIHGYSQIQPRGLTFEIESDKTNGVDKEAKIVNESLKDWSDKIESIFQEEKVYLEPDLSLTELAQKLKTNTSVLSAAINQNFGKNFNDFVNEYRIREFEEQINNPSNQNYTRLAVALDCGFNSKATFNRALKKFGRE
jgi:AraC-like DNA-binding protein